MDWNDTAEQSVFRNQIRSVIDAELPKRYKEGKGPPERTWEFDRKDPDFDAQKAASDWHLSLSRHGWIAPQWPVEYGGAGLSAMEQFILNQELAGAGAPGVGGSGVSMLGPTLIVHGTEAQKLEYLPKILSGETVWAQGYSEPGSGSDLASLQTQATRDGDVYTVNGQKIWTSGAHTADAIFMLVRTDNEASKHRGISFLLVEDMATPGIAVRPLMDMAGNHYFNETFFDDVKVPVDNLVGEENRGWYVGMTLLDFERSNIGGAVAARRSLTNLMGVINDEKKDVSIIRNAIVDRYIESEVMFQFSFRIISMQNGGLLPNYEASTAKLYNSELSQRLALTSTRVFGLHANKISEEDVAGRYTAAYLRSVPATIRGGTSEVQRNIIATRGLGLPRG
ncbi:MAG: hypothetical protein CL718_03140 [Chloroflexi bacterium]|nr:hypothetical protein [Chloroflexota bacterium]|tara:strand:- start:2038 stop:3222 length:1185 start_codon:yes stop_codon:yes gene_type:complete